MNRQEMGLIGVMSVMVIFAIVFWQRLQWHEIAILFSTAVLYIVLKVTEK